MQTQQPNLTKEPIKDLLDINIINIVDLQNIINIVDL